MMMLALLVALALESNDSYREGVRLYGNVELEGASALFEKSLSAAADDSERAKVHAWIGLIHAQLGRMDEARAMFKKAVALDRAVKMPTLAPPDVDAMLEEERLALGPARSPDEKVPADVALKDPPAGESPAEPKPAPAADLPVASFAVGLGGLTALLAGSTVLAYSINNLLVATNKDTFNDDAVRLRDEAYTGYWIAGGLAVVGAAALTSSVFLLPSEPSEPAGDAAQGPSNSSAPTSGR